MEGKIHRRLVCESFSESFEALREFFSFFAPKQPNLREFERVFERVLVPQHHFCLARQLLVGVKALAPDGRVVFRPQND